MEIDKNYNFFMSVDLSPYIGDWIAISDNKIVSHGRDVKKVYKQAKKLLKKKRPLITKVPDKEDMIF